MLIIVYDQFISVGKCWCLMDFEWCLHYIVISKYLSCGKFLVTKNLGDFFWMCVLD